MHIEKYATLCLLVIFSIFSKAVHAQGSKAYPFSINGEINLDSGTIELCFVADSNYYPNSIHRSVTTIKKGRFSFAGSLPYPQAYEINATFSGGDYHSGLFVIEAGTQSVSCNIDSSNKTPKVVNNIMKDYYGSYLDAFKEVARKSALLNKEKAKLTIEYPSGLPDSLKLSLQKQLKQLYSGHDSALLQYVSHYPDSYIGLWEFIFLTNFGYENIYPSIYAQFSLSLKNTYAGILLGKKLRASGVLAVGKKFPPINAVDNSYKKLDTTFYSKSRYTLVDFWYSHCGPCNAQFTDLKRLYKKYARSEFDIIGISTDGRKYRPDWQKCILKNNLPWEQYWDADGHEATNYSINAFPTNYLLDSSGKILKVNLSLIELDDFLTRKGA